MAQASQGSVEAKWRRRKRRNSEFSSDSKRKMLAKKEEREDAFGPRCVEWLREPIWDRIVLNTQLHYANEIFLRTSTNRITPANKSSVKLINPYLQLDYRSNPGI